MKITLREYTLRWRKRPACAFITDCHPACQSSQAGNFLAYFFIGRKFSQ